MNVVEDSDDHDIFPLSVDSVDDSDCAQWSEQRPLSFRCAAWWAQHMPRGKGFVPRLIGNYWAHNEKVLIRTKSRALLAVDPSNLDTYAYTLACGGIMASNVIDACCHFLEDGMVFYDIGANAGVVSLEVAKRFGDRVTVCAFEPQESLARNIAVSAKLNEFVNFHVFRTLLGEEPGIANLYIPKSSAPASHASMKSRTPEAEVVRSRIETLDQLVYSKTIPAPDVIKIDVEGAEFSVLRGAAKLIEKYTPYIIFESDANASRFGYTRREICEFLQSLGPYHFQFPTPDGLVDAGDRLYDSTETDVVAVPEARERPSKT